MDPWKRIFNDVVPMIVTEGMKIGKQLWSWSKNQKIENSTPNLLEINEELKTIVKIEKEASSSKEEPPKKVVVEKNIWKSILDHVNNDYKIPNKRTIEILQPMNVDSFQSLFIEKEKQAPSSTFVDHTIIEPILSKLPRNYQLPNEQALHPLHEMNGDHFDHLFQTSPPSPNTFVEVELWKEVISKLPRNYQLPNDTLDATFKKVSTNDYDHLFQKTHETKQIFLNPELRMLLDNIPTHYKLPDTTMTEILQKLEAEQTQEKEAKKHTIIKGSNKTIDYIFEPITD